MIETKFKRIQCLDRALDIIEVAAEGSCRSVKDMAERIGLNHSTAYNIVKTLMSRNFIEEKHGVYCIGSSLGLLAKSWDYIEGLPVLLRPVMMEIARELQNHHVSVSMRRGDAIETVMLMPDTYGKYHDQFLQRTWNDSLYTASGRVIVAFGEESSWMKCIEFHMDKGLPNMQENGMSHYQFYKMLEEIREKRGIVMRLETPEGKMHGAVAVPIFSPTGVCLGAMGASCHASVATDEKLASVFQLLTEKSRDLQNTFLNRNYSLDKQTGDA